MITALDANTMFLLRTGIGSRNATIATSPITGPPAATCLVSIAGVMLGRVQDHHDRAEHIGRICGDVGSDLVLSAAHEKYADTDAGGWISTSIAASH